MSMENKINIGLDGIKEERGFCKVKRVFFAVFFDKGRGVWGRILKKFHFLTQNFSFFKKNDETAWAFDDFSIFSAHTAKFPFRLKKLKFS